MTFHLFCYYFFNFDPIHTATGHIPAQYWWVEALRIVVRTLIGLLGILLPVPILVWWERRLLSWMQQRMGPNRVGPFGLFQTIADGLKLLFKEDMNPAKVDTLLFVLAPAVFLIPSLVIPGVIPWAHSRTWGAVAPDNSIGVLYLLAWSSLAVYGIVMAGWSSNNKYSLLGGLRSSAQMISYELAMGLAIIAVVLLAGSLNLQEIADKQGGNILHWNVLMFFPLGFFAFLTYTIAMCAETNRAPFDLPEAETELVAGYHTEYTSMKFATFFMGEYANMIIVSAINATLFLGGYHGPFPLVDGQYLQATQHGAWGIWADVAGIAFDLFWFSLKVMAGLYLFIWLRATMPRLRYDMLMRFGWQGLLPISLVNVLLIAVGITYGYPIAAGIWAVVFFFGLIWFAKTKPAMKFANNTRRNESIVLHGNVVPFRGAVSRAGRGGKPGPIEPLASPISESDEVVAS